MPVSTLLDQSVLLGPHTEQLQRCACYPPSCGAPSSLVCDSTAPSFHGCGPPARGLELPALHSALLFPSPGHCPRPSSSLFLAGLLPSAGLTFLPLSAPLLQNYQPQAGICPSLPDLPQNLQSSPDTLTKPLRINIWP